MTKENPLNVAASVRQRLSNRSRETGEAFDFLLQRYAAERFLYRLGESSYRESYVLKGAMLFPLWGGSIYRPTRDLDFTGYGSGEIEDVIQVFHEICRIDVEDDGVVFDANTLTAEPIREETEYHGMRLSFDATLDSTRISMRIDLGFGNAIKPGAEAVDYPTLLDAPVPKICAYPPEAIVAEKLHAMVVLGERNSRLKDFYDLFVICGEFVFLGEPLTASIAATFERRRTEITPNIPTSLTARFYAEPARTERWRAYAVSRSVPGLPAEFAQVGERLIAFLLRPWRALASGEAFIDEWQPGGPWS